MKIAAISDIHGNLGALNAVLADIERRGVDTVVNLGDILSGPLQPCETADRLMALSFPTIRGNHERQILTVDSAKMGASDQMAHALIRPEQRDWIKNLPENLVIFDEVLLVHGTPDSDLTYFLDVVEENICRPATKNEVAHHLASTPTYSLILCGHTHLPRQMQLDNGCLIVNPGSVGLQAYTDEHPFPHKIETGSPHAKYAIVERTAGSWTVEFISVAYDWHAAANLAALNHRPDWVHPLKTGCIDA